VLYRLLFDTVLSRLDPERAHHLAARVLRALAAIPGALPLLARLLAPRDECLRVSAFGLELPSPLGLAAGFDKDASWFEPLGALGFGFVEIGTVTARPQPGNERPRIFRAPARRAVFNRMGFPNPGAEAVAANLARRRAALVVGANVGKSKATELDEAVSDYRHSVRLVAPHADYVAVNVSSPNTPGLVDLQDPERLRPLLAAVREELRAAGDRPLLVKIGPDLSEAALDAVAELARELELDGVIAVNTTTRGDVPEFASLGHGGTSGRPLKERALEVVRQLHARLGDGIPIIGVGGIEDAEDALARIRAGATLLQAHTGFVYGGPLWPSRLNRELARLVRAAGASSVGELVGVDVAPRTPPGAGAPRARPDAPVAR